MGLFRAYDIRGVYGEELTPKISFDIGLAFAQFIGEGKTLSVARDVRLSGPILEYMFKAGILASSCDVIELDVQPTPLIYFSIEHLNLEGGGIVTASHNPPEYNGFKLCREKGFALTYESGIGELEKKVTKGSLIYSPWNRLGRERSVNIRPIYEDYLQERISFRRELRVVIDAGNGTCGFVGDLLKRLGCKVKVLFARPDGRFPSHIPNPLKEETLDALKNEVVDFKADLGIAFDGDGDRVGFIDERGVAIKGDQATLIFAEDLIERSGKGKILFDVATSKAVPEHIQALGGDALMTRVGHSYVMEALHNEGAKMAAEISGHYNFADEYYGFDDGIYASVRMIEILSKTNQKFSEIIQRLPSYVSTPEERRSCSDDKKFKVVQNVKQQLETEGYEMITIDGVRVELEDAWALVRASNTEPAIVLRFEGRTQEELGKVKSIVEEAFENAMKKVFT